MIDKPLPTLYYKGHRVAFRVVHTESMSHGKKYDYYQPQWKAGWGGQWQQVPIRDGYSIPCGAPTHTRTLEEAIRHIRSYAGESHWGDYERVTYIDLGPPPTQTPALVAEPEEGWWWRRLARAFKRVMA